MQSNAMAEKSQNIKKKKILGKQKHYGRNSNLPRKHGITSVYNSLKHT